MLVVSLDVWDLDKLQSELAMRYAFATVSPGRGSCMPYINACAGASEASWSLSDHSSILQELASELNRTDDAPGTSSESARQRTRIRTLPEIKSEDVLPRAGSLNRFSEEATTLT